MKAMGYIGAAIGMFGFVVGVLAILATGAMVVLLGIDLAQSGDVFNVYNIRFLAAVVLTCGAWVFRKLCLRLYKHGAIRAQPQSDSTSAS